MRWLAYLLLATGLDLILLGASSFWLPVLIGTWNATDYLDDGPATHRVELAHGHVALIQEDMPADFTITSINLLVVAAPLLGLGIWLLRLPWSTPVPGYCCCGYNLTGNHSGVCPECGTVASTAAPEVTG